MSSVNLWLYNKKLAEAAGNGIHLFDADDSWRDIDMKFLPDEFIFIFFCLSFYRQNM